MSEHKLTGNLEVDHIDLSSDLSVNAKASLSSGLVGVGDISAILKVVKEIQDSIGDLSELDTENKQTLVEAINEVNEKSEYGGDGSRYYAECSTNGSQAIKSIDIDNFIVDTDGGIKNNALVIITFKNDNTAENPLISINGLQPKGIEFEGEPVQPFYLKAKSTLAFVFSKDNGKWILIGGYSSNLSWL